jgi:DNA polymerase I-like protein with 3'-5' exonuclease and polymerase domains
MARPRNIITDLEQLRELLDHYSRLDAFAFDVETMDTVKKGDRIDPQVGTVCWLSFACYERTDTIPMQFPNGNLVGYLPKVLGTGLARLASGKVSDRRELKPSYLSKTVVEPVFDPDGPPPHLTRGEVFDVIEPLFMNEGILKIGHNIRFDIHAVGKYLDEYPAGPFYDTLVASWLLDVTNRNQFGLAECVKRETGQTLVKGVGKNVLEHPFDEVALYSQLDAEKTWELKEALDRKFASGSPKTSWLLDLEHEVIHSVLEMERTGVRIDTAALRIIDKDLRYELGRLETELFRLAKRPFNIRSARDKQEILYSPRKEGGQGLRGRMTIPTSRHKSWQECTVYDWSTEQQTLEHYRGNKFVDALLDYAFKQKLHSTYVLPYLGGDSVAVHGERKPKTVESKLRQRRIYGQFLQHGTESGRFSSRNPNLQNIPSRTDYGKKLREVFIADPGHHLVVADWSQIEPRIIASLSGDKTMIRTYREGGDVYQAVAKRMDVTRDVGKMLVLAISYGVGPQKIARSIGCTVTEARDLMEFFSQRFSAIAIHKGKVLADAKRKKYSETIMGRRRPVPFICSRDEYERASAERQAYNHLIQGSAADIMKIALVNVHLALPEGARMLLTVHDEIVVQTPEDLVEETITVMKKEMEQARPSKIVVPLVADVGYGRSWAEAKG